MFVYLEWHCQSTLRREYVGSEPAHQSSTPMLDWCTAQHSFRTVFLFYPKKQTNIFSCPEQIKNFQTLLLCSTETCLKKAILETALHLLGFQLFRADRDAESAGKSRGGGTCFYIRKRWWTDVTTLKKMSCPDLEALLINGKPFYFSSFSCSFLVHSSVCECSAATVG